jgi:hypothetical protein
LDVQQDVVPVKKQNLCVLVFVPVASAQIFPTRIQTRTICQMMKMMVAYYSNLMAMSLNAETNTVKLIEYLMKEDKSLEEVGAMNLEDYLHDENLSVQRTINNLINRKSGFELNCSNLKLKIKVDIN